MRAESPFEGGYRQPAEWEPHDGVWLAWPSHDELWAQLLPDAQKEHAALIRAILDPDDDGRPRGETVHLLVPSGMRDLEARTALEELEDAVVFHRMPFGDIWMRDIAPIFVTNDDGEVATVCFAFNGWGHKYILDGDALVAPRVAELVDGDSFAFGMVLEGGAVEADGRGTVLTTRQCLLNDNRNPGMDQAAVERALRQSLGAETVLWLDEGLQNDHTDGHIDTLARFVEPGRVVCMEPRDDDPNHEVLTTVAKDLAAMGLDLETIPSPGRVVDHEDMLMPASYLNFYIANTTVVVPTFGSPHDDEAVERVGALFEGRRAVGLRANTILTGGGAFHCITQPQPARRH